MILLFISSLIIFLIIYFEKIDFKTTDSENNYLKIIIYLICGIILFILSIKNLIGIFKINKIEHEDNTHNNRNSTQKNCL